MWDIIIDLETVTKQAQKLTQKQGSYKNCYSKIYDVIAAMQSKVLQRFSAFVNTCYHQAANNLANIHPETS